MGKLSPTMLLDIIKLLKKQQNDIDDIQNLTVKLLKYSYLTDDIMNEFDDRDVFVLYELNKKYQATIPYIINGTISIKLPINADYYICKDEIIIDNYVYFNVNMNTYWPYLTKCQDISHTNNIKTFACDIKCEVSVLKNATINGKFMGNNIQASIFSF